MNHSIVNVITVLWIDPLRDVGLRAVVHSGVVNEKRKTT